MIMIVFDLGVGRLCAIHGDIMESRDSVVVRDSGSERSERPGGSLRAHDDAHVIIACG